MKIGTGFRAVGSAIRVCTAAGHWQISVYCPGGANCCREGPVKGTAFCTCGLKASIEERTTLPQIEERDTVTTSQAGCTPGTYSCIKISNGFRAVSSAVRVCTAAGNWKISAYCEGGPWCCREGPVKGTAFCTCDAAASDETALQERSTEVASAARECTPGSRKCGKIGSGFRAAGSAVFVCDRSGHWVISKHCGGPDCCRVFSFTGPVCHCRHSAADEATLQEATLEDSQGDTSPSDLAPSKPQEQPMTTAKSLHPPRSASPQFRDCLGVGPFCPPKLSPPKPRCSPGTSFCIGSAIHNCDHAGNAIKSVTCGRSSSCCKDGPTPGTPFCVC